MMSKMEKIMGSRIRISIRAGKENKIFHEYFSLLKGTKVGVRVILHSYYSSSLMMQDSIWFLADGVEGGVLPPNQQGPFAVNTLTWTCSLLWQTGSWLPILHPPPPCISITPPHPPPPPLPKPHSEWSVLLCPLTWGSGMWLGLASGLVVAVIPVAAVSALAVCLALLGPCDRPWEEYVSRPLPF